MSNLKYIFLLLVSLSFIVCLVQNKTKETKAHEPPLKQVTTNLNATNQSSFKNKPPKPPESFNITIDEMDKMMLCTIVSQQSTKKKQKEIEGIVERLHLTDKKIIDKVFDKVGVDIFEKCTKEVDIKLVNKYMKNLTYFHNFKWEKCYDDYNQIDYDKFKGEKDLKYTAEQKLLMHRYSKVNEIYKQKKEEEIQNMNNENKKIRIGNFEINSLPSSFKIGFFMVILLIIFGTIFYFLKTLGKKSPGKKKKEKKKKIQ